MKFDCIAFAIILLCFFTFTIFTFMSTSKQQNKFYKKNKKGICYTAIGCEILFFILAILDISGALEFGGYTKLSLGCAIFGGIGIGLLKLLKKLPEKFHNILRFSLRSIIICAFLEMFVFNFNSAHLFGGDYQGIVLSPEKAVTENYDIATGSNSYSGYSSLEFTNVNMPVGTISIEAKSNTKGNATINIDMSDDTNSDYRYGVASVEVLRNNQRSETIPCNFSGNVHNLKFSFYTDDGESVSINSIILNIPIFFSFSFVRFFILLLTSLAVYMLTISPVFKKSFGENKLITKCTAYAFTAVLILVALFLTNAGRYSDTTHSLKKDFSLKYGNQMTQELVDAFEDGKVTLSMEPAPELLSLENPYDWSQRTNAGVNYQWDHLLFGGQYYSYYGIAPVVMLFLPYHLATDHYFPSAWAVWIFACIGIFFLTKFYISFMSKFFSRIRSSLFLLGLFIMQLITGIWFCFSTPNFYEIAQTSGFACIALGAFFLISSNVIGEGKIKNWRLALSTVFLSLAVLCRPTLAIYCFASLIFIYAGFKKKKLIYTNNKLKLKYYIPYLLFAFVPFVAIGGVQMLYNQARFGSIFDFGIQYSLTINDFTSAQYHTHFVLIGFFNYLFAMPSFSPNFPFFDTSDVHTFLPQGYYFVATMSAVGLLWKSLPIISYSYGIKAYRGSKNENKRLYTIILFAVCLIAPFIIMFSIWESGYGTRYCVDFAWQILLGALVIAFIMFEKCSLAFKNHLNKIMTASAVICLILSVAQVYNWAVMSPLSIEGKAAFLSFGRLFEFWR